jgi:hypothetical protein
VNLIVSFVSMHLLVVGSCYYVAPQEVNPASGHVLMFSYRLLVEPQTVDAILYHFVVCLCMSAICTSARPVLIFTNTQDILRSGPELELELVK